MDEFAPMSPGFTEHDALLVQAVLEMHFSYPLPNFFNDVPTARVDQLFDVIRVATGAHAIALHTDWVPNGFPFYTTSGTWLQHDLRDSRGDDVEAETLLRLGGGLERLEERQRPSLRR